MRTSVTKERAGAPCFKSAEELRDVLDSLLREIDKDSDLGPRLRSAKVPHRLVFTDLDVTLDVAGSEDPDHHVRWSFGGDPGWKPALTLEMKSADANRYFQGRLNLMIAIARRQVRIVSEDPRAVLAFLPLSGALCASYRRLVESSYPHLKLA